MGSGDSRPTRSSDLIGENVDHQAQDGGHVQERDDGVEESDPPHRSTAHRHIRGLIAHGDREGVVEKIPVIWWLVVGKTQPFPDGKRGIALVHVVIPMGVVERVEDMEENPGQHDRQQRRDRVDVLVERSPVLGDVGHETHPGHAETREDHGRHDDETVTRLPILVVVLDILRCDPVDPVRM